MRVGSAPQVRNHLILLGVGLAALCGATLLPKHLAEGPLPGVFEPERIELSIPMRPFMLLDHLRLQALERGLLTRSENDVVGGTLFDGLSRQKVLLRLKGDYTDHLKTDQWSWRVQMKGDGQVGGMRRFSLQAPNTRRYHWEALLLDALRDEGVISPRYTFVDLAVNGSDIGVMALEEHFSKELLESQGRKEGVLFRFEEDAFWAVRARVESTMGGELAGTRKDLSWRDARIRPFRSGVIAKSEVLQDQASIAVGLMRGLQEGTLAPSAVLDANSWGTFLAANEVWGFWHGLRWHNVRFYLNPYTMKVEPVAYDTSTGRPEKDFLSRVVSLVFARQMLADPEIYAAYSEELARIRNPKTMDAVLARAKRRARPLEAKLRPTYPKLPRKVTKALRSRASRLGKVPTQAQIAKGQRTGRGQAVISKSHPYAAGVFAHLAGGQVEVFTGLKEDVELREIRVNGHVVDLPEEPVALPASYYDEPRKLFRMSVAYDESTTVEVTVFVPSDGRTYDTVAERYQPTLSEPILPESGTLQAVLATHPTLSYAAGAFTLEGQHTITEPLVLPRVMQTPEGVVHRPSLRIAAGSHLHFTQDALILTWGSVHIEGTSKAPVTLEGSGWRGLTVLGGGAQTVRMTHTTVRDTDHAALGRWALTGGVTLYKSDVSLTHVGFENTQAEDALNIVSSTFTMDDVQISGTRSDAFDADFSDGSVTGSTFTDVGGDAIDLSGSVVTVADVELVRVHDKALSVGERSTLEGDRVVVRDSGVAVVSKDASTATVRDVEVQDAELATFMAYAKKPEYGPAFLTIEGTSAGWEGVAQRGSELEVDGRAVPTVDIDVDALYSAGVMRK